MSERKSEQYVRQSKEAAEAIASMPAWMERNLEPPRVPRYIEHYAGPRDQTWTTPLTLFEPLHEEFGFTLDGAASSENAVLPSWSEMRFSWVGQRVFCNPPWGSIPPFVELAGTADLAVLLVPARTNAKWFHRALELGAEVRFFLGRPRFGDGKGSSPVDCVLLIFGAEP